MISSPRVAPSSAPLRRPLFQRIPSDPLHPSAVPVSTRIAFADHEQWRFGALFAAVTFQPEVGGQEPRQLASDVPSTVSWPTAQLANGGAL